MNEHNDEAVPPSRWAFIRDVAVFQGKLVIDGLRDLVLVPLSLAAAIIGMLAEPKDPGKKFYRVVAFGRRSDRWINLFGAARSSHPEEFTDEDADHGIDDLVARLELRIVEQNARGGITAQARRAVDGALDRLTATIGKANRHSPGESGDADNSGNSSPGNHDADNSRKSSPGNRGA